MGSVFFPEWEKQKPTNGRNPRQGTYSQFEKFPYSVSLQQNTNSFRRVAVTGNIEKLPRVDRTSGKRCQ